MSCLWQMTQRQMLKGRAYTCDLSMMQEAITLTASLSIPSVCSILVNPRIDERPKLKPSFEADIYSCFRPRI